MEIYSLNDNFTIKEIIEDFESFVWAERFNDVGDFELVVPYSERSEEFLRLDTFVGMDASDRVMKIENVLDFEEDDGGRFLKVSGRSLEYLLEYRSIFGFWIIDEEKPYVVSGLAHEIIDKALRDTLIEPFQGEHEKLPYYTEGTRYPEDNNIYFDEVLTYSITKPMKAMDYIKELAKPYRVGFRIYRHPTQARLYVNTYVGSNRTSEQNVHNPVIFSRYLGNVEKLENLKTNKDRIDRVQVYSESGFSEVWWDNAPLGVFHKTVSIDVKEPEEAITREEKNAYRIHRGYEVLMKSRDLEVSDCEVSKTNDYIYKEDYHLGDLVDVFDHLGNTIRMRVVEQIFTKDENGDRSYPTLEAESLITRDSWAGTDPNLVWAMAQGTWSEK